MTHQEASSVAAGHYVEANGLNIYYEEYCGGEPLLSIHGDTVSHNMWKRHIPEFAKHFKVIAPDSRGHGRTKNPADILTYRLMADDTVEFIRVLGLNRPLFYGYSGGGQIALEIAMRYPGLVQACIIGGASYRWLPQYYELCRGMGVDGPGIVDFERMERDNPGMVQRMREQHDAYQGEGYWRTYMKQLSVEWWAPLNYSIEELHKIVDPVLLLIGDRDEFTPVAENVHIYSTISGAELAVAPDCTHMFPFSNPSMLTNLSLDFLLRHQAQSKQG